MPRKDSALLEQLSRQLPNASGPTYWRSLEELAGTEEFQTYLHREFPEAASEWDDQTDRRNFLRVMAASFALGGLAGCRTKTAEKIVPYVRQPEQLVPGKPLFYATAAPTDGFGVGVLVESHMGRPTKIEGNPDHPASLGATTAAIQASILDLYDPDRSRTVTYRRQIQTWDTFLTRLKPKLDTMQKTGGAGLRILTRNATSPTLVGQLQTLMEQLPQAKLYASDPVISNHTEQGCQLAFDQRLTPVYDFRRADVVLSLAADFLSVGPGQTRYGREFADRRSVAGYRAGDSPERMSRIYAVEPTPSITGAKADHRLPLRPNQVESFARSVAVGLGVPGVIATDTDAVPTAWVNAVVDDLQNYRNTDDGSCVVVAGPWEPPSVHAVAHAINAHLDATGKAVRYCKPSDLSGAFEIGSINELIEEMQAGKVEMLVILDANPIYDSSLAGPFIDGLQNVALKIHFGLYQDETSFACDWHVPAQHYLESWGDIRAYDGTVSIQQPLIAPMYAGRSVNELVSALSGKGSADSRELVKQHWQISEDKVDAEDRWQTWLHDGFVPETAAKSEPVELSADLASRLGSGQRSATDNTEQQIVFRPDPAVHDGSLANNGWLQELPKPFTKLTWDNAALISPSSANKLGVSNGDGLLVKTSGGEAELPCWILPGQADDVITCHLGFGRTRVGHVGNGVGVNVNPLRSDDSSWLAQASVSPTGATVQLASTQHHFLLDGRDIIRGGTVDQLQAQPEHPPFVQPHHPVGEASLLPEVPYDGYKWGMVIDLNACTGCNACVVACQSENNIPVVGKEQVAKGREMHWLRIDTYFSESLQDPRTSFQPLPCMHCEKAPCELVCPVAATTHSPSGINEMTYNRCVGTRYCANNCPYKVRRFNFLTYTQPVEKTPELQLLQNPDVTVRARGVMEKCTYCVQRVNAARIEAEKEDRSIRDGEVVSACQAVCPAQAIQFGDLNDTSSIVSRAHRSPLRYSLLEELNTQPRTTYLAEVRNPNRALLTTNGANSGH